MNGVEKRMLCPGCGRPVPAGSRACEHCGALLGAGAVYDPVATAEWQGRGIGSALIAPKTPLILAGIWLASLTLIAGAAAGIHEAFGARSGAVGWIVAAAGMAAWVGVVAWTWRRYKRLRQSGGDRAELGTAAGGGHDAGP
jgi:hypothetical protein